MTRMDRMAGAIKYGDSTQEANSDSDMMDTIRFDISLTVIDSRMKGLR